MTRIDGPADHLKILVVDDDARLRDLFEDLLERDGFEVEYAADGRSAFERIRRSPYSVILLDLMMPDVTGFDLLARLERDSPGILRRTIIMTGAPQSELDRIDTSRVWGVLRKPLDASQLVTSARLCADGRRRPAVA